MCYGKPGPRCSGHARVALAKAKAEGFTIKTNAAQEAYDETPEGRAKLIAAGEVDTAAIALVRYTKKVDEYKAVTVGKKTVDVEAINAQHEKAAEAYEIAENMNIDDAWTAVKDPTTEPALLNAILEKNPTNTNIKYQLLTNPNTPTEALARLMRTKVLQEYALRHPNISPATLKKYAAEPSDERYGEINHQVWAAANPMLDEEDSARLLVSDSHYVRRSLAEHTAKEHIMKALAAISYNYELTSYLAVNHRLSKSLQEEFVASGDAGVISNLARNPNADNAVLKSIYENGDDSVQRSVFNNPNIDDETYLTAAFAHPDDYRFRVDEKRVESILRKREEAEESYDPENPLPVAWLKRMYGYK